MSLHHVSFYFLQTTAGFTSQFPILLPAEANNQLGPEPNPETTPLCRLRRSHLQEPTRFNTKVSPAANYPCPTSNPEPGTPAPPKNTCPEQARQQKQPAYAPLHDDHLTGHLCHRNTQPACGCTTITHSISGK